jgi:phage shock protein C
MPEEIKKFYRSRTDRILFGVCGGLGKYFSVDPILFRLFFVLLLFSNGVGIPLYLVMVLVTQEEPGRSDKKKDLEGEVSELADKIEKKAEELSGEIKIEKKDSSSGRDILGYLIVLFGVFLLLRNMYPAFWIDNGIVFALAIIAIGCMIVFKK